MFELTEKQFVFTRQDKGASVCQQVPLFVNVNVRFFRVTDHVYQFRNGRKSAGGEEGDGPAKGRDHLLGGKLVLRLEVGLHLLTFPGKRDGDGFEQDR